MIKVELENEQPKHEAKVIFDFRRHKQADQPSNREKLYLTCRLQPSETGPAITYYSETYPIVIDGNKQIVKIRTREFEKLGFRVDIETF